MTVSFAMLEQVIQFFTWMLFNENQRIGQIATAQIPFRNLRPLLISLYLERYGKDNDFKKLECLLKKADTVGKRRNQITHSFWGAGGDADSITVIKPTTNVKFGYVFPSKYVSSEDLSSFVIEIKELTSEIQDFSIAIAEQGKPFRE